MKRLEAIAPLLEFASREIDSARLPHLGGVAVQSMNSMVSYLADQHHVSPRTLWNWYAQYRSLGYAGLVDRVRSDKGESRFLKAHPAAGAFIENIYLGERLSIRLLYDALNGIGGCWNPRTQGYEATAQCDPTWPFCPSHC